MINTVVTVFVPFIKKRKFFFFHVADTSQQTQKELQQSVKCASKRCCALSLETFIVLIADALHGLDH